MRTKFLLIALMFTAFAALAQQDAQYTQYMYNTINVNPAYAGSRGVMSIFGLHRTQWVGLDGAPVTNAASINTPINNSNLGVGLSFVNDKIGPTNENAISADVSYTVKTSETFKLSFGVKGTANLFNLDVNKLNPQDAGDPQFQNLDADFTPNIGAGLFLFSDATYVGLSVPNFIITESYDDIEESVIRRKVHYYLQGGYVFDFNENLKFKPSFLAKVVEGAPVTYDVSANFMFKEKFVLGAGYRFTDAFSALAGFQIAPSLFIGYAYDRSVTKLQKYNDGSHEIILKFNLQNRTKIAKSPRFF